MNLFKNELLPLRLQKALEAMKFETPTEIQKATIPMAVEGSDIIGCAQTGTGKTAAFGIPIVAQIIEDPKKRAVILAPTRELATQIRDVILELSKHSQNIRCALLIGGASMFYQLKSLRNGASIVIATPGRLMDHIRRRNIDISGTTTVVLDEADRMLDMGFGPQIDEIFKFLPKERQTLLFSATLPPKILKLAERFLRNPKHIKVGSINEPTAQVDQQHIQVDGNLKNERLLQELTTRRVKTLVFTRTKRRADKLAKFLYDNEVPASCIHGDRSQSQRQRAVDEFRSGRKNVLVATDVASRGLDVDQIGLVVNFDLPESREDYIHRIGRTGRAGEVGAALSFVCADETGHWAYLQNVKDSKRNERFSSSRKQMRRPQRRPGGRGMSFKQGDRFGSRRAS